ncbi:MAG: hypothetical protein WCX73_05315 [Candidatus Pacearchaeota archaeon]|jgi:hypothetical protein
MDKKISLNPLKAEWDKKEGNVTRKCNVCQKDFKVEHWNQTVCKDPVCKQYTFCSAHIKSSYKRWEEVSKQVKALGYKPSFAFTNNK